MNLDLQGKNAFVTGAGSGIGRATVIAMARSGINVMATDIDEAALLGTLDLVGSGGGQVEMAVVDVSSATQVREAVNATARRFGSMDIGFNNAGVNIPGVPLADIDEAAFRKVMDVNLYGVLFGMQAQIPLMVEQGGGAIINTASICGLIAEPALVGHYTASKHAVIGLTKTAALEYGPQGVRTNAICPGFIETDMIRQVFETAPAARALSVSKHPIGRPGMPEEVAEAVLWLASPRSGFVLGASLMIDGGYTIQ